MNKKLLMLTCLVFTTWFTHAQSYQWVKGGGSTEAMTPSRNYENIKNMCTDDDGNVYITAIVGATSIMADTFFQASAHNTFGSTPHILFASYRCDGMMRFAKLIECSDETLIGNNNWGNNGLAYSNGSVYMVGAFYGYAAKYIGYDTTIRNTFCESFTARFDTSGEFKWIQFVGTNDPSTQLLTGSPGVVAVDGQGFIHNFNAILGPGVQLTPSIVSGTNGTYDLKYDTSGNLINATRMQLDSIWLVSKVVFNKLDNKYYTVLSPNGSYYFTYHSTLNSAICAFNPDGTMNWIDTTGGGGNVNALDYKGGKEIYVAGTGVDTFSFGGLLVENTIYARYYDYGTVFKLDTNGAAEWVYRLQSNESYTQALDVTIVPGEKVAIAGAIVGTNIHGTDTLVSTAGEGINSLFLIVDSSGRTIKLDQFHGSGDNDQGSAVTSDGVGNVYVGGMVNTSVSATGLTPYTSHGGNSDFYVLKYGVDCSCLVAPVANFTDTGTTRRGFTYTGTTTGLDSLVWTYGDGHRDTGMHALHTFTAGTYTVCATVYTSCGSNEYCKSITIGRTGISNLSFADVIIYPNPVSDQLMIDNAIAGTTIKLFNIVGQQVYTDVIASNHQPINTHGLPAGNYIIQLNDINGNRITKTIVKF